MHQRSRNVYSHHDLVHDKKPERLELLRIFTNRERLNVEHMVRLNAVFGLLEPTESALRNRYFGATREFCEFLRVSAVYDDVRLLQGPGQSVIRKVTLIGNGKNINTELTLTRSDGGHDGLQVKISHLDQICNGRELLAVLAVTDQLFVVRLDESIFESETGWPRVLHEHLQGLERGKITASTELEEMIRGLALRGFIKTHRTGDTAVGHLLETELGIIANSNKTPDYKGIEIKSTRAKTQNRQTMFAKVPDWKQSFPGSTAEFLQLFGYDRRGFPELNCEVSSKRPNSLGLRLRLSPDGEFLEEFSEGRHPMLTLRWTIESLRIALDRKHPETFWVKATSDRRNDGEYIRFDSIVHTCKPMLEQVAPLLASGAITLDHLISKKPGRGVKEQGPLFKIAAQEFHLLFPRLREVNFNHMA